MHHAAILLIPAGNLPIRPIEARDRAPRSQRLQMSRPRRQRLPRRRRHALEDVLLVQAPAHAPVEEPPRLAPLQAVADDALGLHAARAVVQVREL